MMVSSSAEAFEVAIVPTFYFCFCVPCQGRHVQKCIPNAKVPVYCLHFLPSLMVSGLPFRSSIHLEFVFVYAVRSDPVSLFGRWLSSSPKATY